MISPIVWYTKWDCKSYFGSASHVFLSYRLSQWYMGSKLGLFLALDTHIKLKLMLQVFFVWCGIILTMTRYCGQKRKDNMWFTKFNNLSRIIQHGNHLQISNDSLYNKKYVCKQIIQDWNNLLLFYMLCFFVGSSAQMRLIVLSYIHRNLVWAKKMYSFGISITHINT
jgi:hypothetical protein